MSEGTARDRATRLPSRSSATAFSLLRRANRCANRSTLHFRYESVDLAAGRDCTGRLALKLSASYVVGAARPFLRQAFDCQVERSR